MPDQVPSLAHKMEKLFSYGTLQDPVIQEKVFNHTLTGSADVLDNYEVLTQTISTEGALKIIREKLGSQVVGTVYEISADELSKADKYEGNNYRRIAITLLSGTKSWVYVQA